MKQDGCFYFDGTVIFLTCRDNRLKSHLRRLSASGQHTMAHLFWKVLHFCFFRSYNRFRAQLSLYMFYLFGNEQFPQQNTCWSTTYFTVEIDDDGETLFRFSYPSFPICIVWPCLTFPSLDAISQGRDGFVKIWKLSDGKETATLSYTCVNLYYPLHHSLKKKTSLIKKKSSLHAQWNHLHIFIISMISYPFQWCISSEDFAIFLPLRSSSSSFPSSSTSFSVLSSFSWSFFGNREEGRKRLILSLCQGSSSPPFPLHTICRLLVENIYRVLHILPVRASARRHGRNRYKKGWFQCEDSETEGLLPPRLLKKKMKSQIPPTRTANVAQRPAQC